jgi:hypothetical protein
MLEYCRELDGTEIRVIPLPEWIDRIPHPVGVEHAIRWIGSKMEDPWLYLEADSPPLKEGWLSTITKEHYESGKLFTLPSLDGLSKHDVASAIGVWPPHLEQYLPVDLPGAWPYFDFHIYRNHPEKIHFTRTIQHSYCLYSGETNRCSRRHEFPKDKAMLYPEAVIFHADPSQSIIRGGLIQSFYHSGDLGDIIASLPIIKKQGGGKLVLGPHSGTRADQTPREPMNPALFASIKPLLDQQPYLNRVAYGNTPCDFNLSKFRTLAPHREPMDNLALWQARFLGHADDTFDLRPWIELDTFQPHNRVVCSKSLRYSNPRFPWREIGKKYGEEILFVGNEGEHRMFEVVAGVRCEKARTPNVLELAKVIAGGRLQFSNQSLPWWLGAGLGKEVWQETFVQEPNSVIEREGLHYTRTDAEIEILNQYLNAIQPQQNPGSSQTVSQ